MPTPDRPFGQSVRRLSRVWRRLCQRAARAGRRLYDPYPGWLARRISGRSGLPPAETGRFSLLTSVYAGTPARLFEQTAQTVFDQAPSQFEWVLLAHGPVSPETDRVVQRVAMNPHVRFLQREQNLGILGAMRLCLESAQGDYIVPLDADDLLTRDALAVLSHAIDQQGRPEFVYTDEDLLVGRRPQSPFFRPDWDPVLNLSNSYIWHLCAFRRLTALDLGVYSDSRANYCHDWDTVFRFANAGFPIVHLPEVVHHWRRHARSTTNQNAPHAGSLDSQRFVLERQIFRQPDPARYEVVEFPMFRGAQEWTIHRRPVDPQPADLVILAGPSRAAPPAAVWLDGTDYPIRAVHFLGAPPDTVLGVEAASEPEQLRDAPRCGRWAKPAVQFWPTVTLRDFAAAAAQLSGVMTVVCSAGLWPRANDWLWEALKMFEFHADLCLIAGRVVSDSQEIVAGGELFEYGGPTCPEAGWLIDDPGPYGMFLKPRSVDAVAPEFFIARTAFLQRALLQIDPTAARDSWGVWLGGLAAEEGQRVATNPLIAAMASPDWQPRGPIKPADLRLFAKRFSARAQRTRWFSGRRLPASN